jgi:hypothetical protein
MSKWMHQLQRKILSDPQVGVQHYLIPKKYGPRTRCSASNLIPDGRNHFPWHELLSTLRLIFMNVAVMLFVWEASASKFGLETV